MKRFRGGLVFKAHRWLYHSTLGSRVIQKNSPPALVDVILFWFVLFYLERIVDVREDCPCYIAKTQLERIAHAI